MTTDIPETVACPCGNGYAERRETPIREAVGNGDGRAIQLTHLYRHDGCPVGGHIVTQDGTVTRRAGPLFNGGLTGWAVREGEAVRLQADGGQP